MGCVQNPLSEGVMGQKPCEIENPDQMTGVFLHCFKYSGLGVTKLQEDVDD